MAIKSISLLDKFDNQTATSRTDKMAIGKSIALFSEELLTKNDIDCIKASTVPNDLRVNTNVSGYWSILFEISQPEHPNDQNPNKYFSRKLTYEDLVKNVMWDVKGYLNYRNNLNDYDLKAIVDGDYTFNGNKTFNGSLSVVNDVSANRVFAKNISAQNLSVSYISCKNELVNSLTVIDMISTLNDEMIFDGYAIGLKDKTTSAKISCGTWSSTYDNPVYGSDLSGAPDRTGDPICFKDGKPYELTCVNRSLSANVALLAYGIADDEGTMVNCGDITHPVYFRDGHPISTDIIERAKKSYWADLGERYIPDAPYEPGTLVKFGGEKEITIADDEVNAVVSKSPFELNCDLEGGIPIALCGRTPIKVKGKIKKFDRITLSDTPGIGCKANSQSIVIGRALESSDDEGIKLIECVTQFRL